MSFSLVRSITIISVVLLCCNLLAFAQQITLVKNKMPLKDVLDSISIQSGYGIYYNHKQISAGSLVNIAVRRVSIEKALVSALFGKNLYYDIIGDNVIIKPKNISLAERVTGYFKAFTAKGQVSDDNGYRLYHAIVELKGSGRQVLTDQHGNFSMNQLDKNDILMVSFIGYEKQEVLAGDDLSDIRMKREVVVLNTVEIVSTGYQDIPKERATGAFTEIGEKLFNRSVGINIIDRLEGVTSGVLLNRGLPPQANNSKTSIRGRSTLNANAETLIVVDGIPYDGTIDQINPNDIASVTILKDAAAASIWGTRSGNGVIVITSKKGQKNTKMAASLSTTTTISNKPDLNYIPQISSPDYVLLEKDLFLKGFYDNTLSLQYSAVSPVVEIMAKLRNGEITAGNAERQLELLMRQDVRSDLRRYVYRPKVYQQYQVNLAGGGENNTYYMSAGYDKNRENMVTNGYDRITLNARNSFSMLNGKLEMSGDITFSSANTSNKFDIYIPTLPYDRLADDQGNSLPLINSSVRLRQGYVDTAGKGKLLDWSYRPKDELKPNQNNHQLQYKLRAGLNYNISKELRLSANYQYLKEHGGNRGNYGLDGFYTRNIVNTYSIIIGDEVSRAVPLGEILYESKQELTSEAIRIQMNYQKMISGLHEISAIAGYEARDARTHINNQILYGYNPANLTNGNNSIDPTQFYPHYYQPFNSGQISTASTLYNYTDITQSFYGNISYSYGRRYTLTASLRKDQSNLFGVNANGRSVPLFSLGTGWDVSKEKFYPLEWLPSLKLRLTYGHNGNIDKTVPGFLSVQNIGFINPWASPYTKIINPPNPSLRWERVKTWNIGLDYGLLRSRMSGSIDLYQKNAVDLIGNNILPMQTGITEFRGNGASTQTKGIEIAVNSKNINKGFAWSTSLLFNYNTDKVTHYKVKASTNYEIVTNNYNNPLIGYPYYALFSFPTSGLDGAGAPRGYLNGELSQNYKAIAEIFDPVQLKYHGSASPNYFGNFINTFNYKGFELSVNIGYKFKYYFRRTDVFSGSNYGSGRYQLSGYTERWQKPGDEYTTIIPALFYPQNSNMSTFFLLSSALVEPGDHVRLQDIRLTKYILNRHSSTSSLKRCSIFLYASNFGIIWRKNKFGIDPNYGSSLVPQPFSCSIGLNLNL